MGGMLVEGSVCARARCKCPNVCPRATGGIYMSARAMSDATVGCGVGELPNGGSRGGRIETIPVVNSASVPNVSEPNACLRCRPVRMPRARTGRAGVGQRVWAGVGVCNG